ncbi:MAG: hypothetical protein AAGA77_04790 [Bacteroidota bacterium]
MNIEEMQKIWNSDTQEHLYAIDEKGMEKIVFTKRNKAIKRVNLVENIILWMNILLPSFLIILAFIKGKDKVSIYAMEAFMFLTAAYIAYHKNLRIKSYKNWGKSMMDVLEEAIHNATYQARLSNTLLIWYLLGLAIISIAMLILEGKPWWLILLMGLFFGLAFIFGRWEQRCFHNRYRDELITLKKKLQS